LVLWNLYDWRFSAVTLAAVGGYIVFSVTLSEWRIKFVRRMNDADTEANAKAIDSLLNYETVKYFGNEEHEARRFDVGRRRYEQAAIRSSRTLSLLNVGQGAIISGGLVAVMVMAGYGVKAGTMTLGDFVAVNAFLIQLYMPLNMLGFAYREIRNALVNMERCSACSTCRPRSPTSRARRPRGERRRDRVRPCRLPLREGAADPARRELPRGAGRHGGDRGLERRRQVDRLAHPVPLLRRRRRAACGSTARTSATSPSRACARRSAWCRRTPCCSTTRSTTTSATAGPDCTREEVEQAAASGAHP
jgi:hypothetical protein